MFDQKATAAIEAAQNRHEGVSLDRESTRLISEFASWGDVAPSTRHKRLRFIAEFAVWLEVDGQATLLTATRRHVNSFLAHLNGSRALSPSSRKGALCAVRAFYKFLHAFEYLDRDPTFGIDSPKIKLKQGRTMTPDQVVRFLEADGSPRDRAQAYTYVFTAGRTSDLSGLRWPDVDFEEKRIRFHGKGGKVEWLPMHPMLYLELKRYQAWQLKAAEADPAVALALADDETAWVFLSETGGRLADSTFGKQVRWRAARAGLAVRQRRPEDKYYEMKSHITPHVLRRSWATNRLNEGVPLDLIADVLRHSSVDTTRRHYAFGDPERVRGGVNTYNPFKAARDAERGR